ncbi:MAG: CPBP family intramembrane metalloprotease [Gammaproteobacteria bacterium]|nr:CPBP family intramembrane metalloprotease [Gammaproteobacteria bacterium]
MKKPIPSSKIQFGFAMWLIGMVGAFAVLLMLPTMVSNKPSPIPMWAIYLIQVVQSGVILGVFVWIGVTLAHKVNLKSPCIEALVSKESCWRKLLPQLGPACIGGVIVGILLVGMNYLTPHELSITTNEGINPLLKVLAEVFYGGITEEILLRWGVMTLLLWLLWRFIQRDQSTPSQKLVWIAIITSSLLFAFAHLPAAHVLAGHLTLNIFAYVVVGNSLAGMMFGFLYQRFGLESAMIAHALAHLVADAALVVFP